MIRAKCLITSIDFDGDTVISFHYTIDDQVDDTIMIHLPRTVPLSQTHFSLLGVLTSFIVAQLCLVETILLNFHCSQSMIESALPMLSLLYNARCWRGRRSLLPLPNIILAQDHTLPKIGKNSDEVDIKHAYLLWSGGKDSTLSLLLLRANGYKVSTTHVTANTHTIDLERKAVTNLSNLFGVSVDCIKMIPQSLIKIGRKYSPNFAHFPEITGIPEGREFLLLALIATLAYFDNASTVCARTEYESYRKILLYEGTPIYQYNSQAEMGYQLLTAYLSRWYGSHFIAFSPLATITEFRVFKTLLHTSPQSFHSLTSCFWDRWCGRCFKCFRYALMQSVLGSSILQFQVDPLTESSYLKQYVKNW